MGRPKKLVWNREHVSKETAAMIDEFLAGKLLSLPRPTSVNYRRTVFVTDGEPLTFIIPVKAKGAVVGDPCRCAAANEIKKQLPGVVVPWVFNTRTKILRTDGVLYVYKNPNKLKGEIGEFDRTHGIFRAGEYKLMSVPEGDVTAARRERSGYDGTHTSKGIREHRKRPAYAR